MFKAMTACVASIVIGALSCGKEKTADAQTGVTMNEARTGVIATH